MNLNHRASINSSSRLHIIQVIYCRRGGGGGGGGDMSIFELSHGHIRGEYLKTLTN